MSKAEEALAKLVAQYGVVKILLEYLPMKDLINASEACHYWNQIGDIVRSRRPFGPALFSFHRFSVERTKDLVLYSNNVEISPEATVWVESNLLQPQEAECTATLDAIEPFIQSKLENAAYFIEPSQLILIASPVMSDFLDIIREDPEYDDEVKSALEVFSGGMYSTVPTIVAFSNSGVLYGAANNTDVTHVADTRRQLGFMAGLVLPKQEGVTIRQFSIDPSEFNKAYNDLTPNVLMNIQENDQVKAIVLFNSNERQSIGFTEYILLHYLDNYPNVELAGGIVVNTLDSTAGPTAQPATSGIVFSGNVVCKAISLSQVGQTGENKKRMLKFKELNMEEDGSVAFVFYCCGRRSFNSEKVPTELIFFKENYPRTTLIGTLSEGEFFFSETSKSKMCQFKDFNILYSFHCSILFIAGPTKSNAQE